jgi:hypothetical protein
MSHELQPKVTSTDFDPINQLHEDVSNHLRNGLEAAIKAGNLLIDIKSKCPKGCFEAYLRQYFKASIRHAQRYMQIARNVHVLPDREATRVSLLSMRKALSAIGTTTTQVAQVPEDVRFKVLGQAIKDERFAIGSAIKTTRPTQLPVQQINSVEERPATPASSPEIKIVNHHRRRRTDEEWAEALNQLDQLADELKAIVATRPPKYDQAKIAWCIDHIVATAFPDCVVVTDYELSKAKSEGEVRR